MAEETPQEKLTDALSEMQLVGSVIATPNMYRDVGAICADTHFGFGVNRSIWKMIGVFIARDRDPRPASLSRALRDDKLLQANGGEQYLLDCMQVALPTDSDIRDYALYIRELADRRALRDAMLEAIDQIETGEPGVGDVPAVAGAALATLQAASSGVHGFTQTVKAVDAAQLAYEAMRTAQAGETATGITTGLQSLDEAIGRMEDGELWIVAGRPGMGKTALAMGIAQHVAQHYGAAAVIALEMTALQTGRRMLASYSGVSGTAIRRGEINMLDDDKLVEAMGAIFELDMQIFESMDMTLEDVLATCEREASRKKLRVVVIDYLQLLTTRARVDNRTQEVSIISRALKGLAKRLGCPVIALSQLSRQVDGRDDKRPRMSDLRESGSIEQDADGILMTYREEEYLSRKRPQATATAEQWETWKEAMEVVKGRAEVLIEKQRSGASGGTCVLHFDGPTTRFTDAD